MTPSGKNFIMASKSKTKKAVLWAVIITTVLIISVLSIALMLILNPRVEVGLVEVEIHGDDAEVLVHMEMVPEFDISGSRLRLEFDNRSFPMEVKGAIIKTQLRSGEFRELMDAGYGNITGEVKAKFLFSTSRNIKETVDLTFLAKLGESIEVSSVDTEIISLSTVEAKVEFTAEVQRDVKIRANDTEAELTTSTGNYTCLVKNLVLNPDDKGVGDIQMPMAAILSLALRNSTMRIDLWGIVILIDFPVSG